MSTLRERIEDLEGGPDLEELPFLIPGSLDGDDDPERLTPEEKAAAKARDRAALLRGDRVLSYAWSEEDLREILPDRMRRRMAR